MPIEAKTGCLVSWIWSYRQLWARSAGETKLSLPRKDTDVEEWIPEQTKPISLFSNPEAFLKETQLKHVLAGAVLCVCSHSVWMTAFCSHLPSVRVQDAENKKWGAQPNACLLSEFSFSDWTFDPEFYFGNSEWRGSGTLDASSLSPSTAPPLPPPVHSTRKCRCGLTTSPEVTAVNCGGFNVRLNLQVPWEQGLSAVGVSIQISREVWPRFCCKGWATTKRPHPGATWGPQGWGHHSLHKAKPGISMWEVYLWTKQGSC